jgi:hypothetical protein
MDIDDDEDGTQRPKAVADYGIEVNFESIDEDDRMQDPAEMVAQLDKEIASANNDIERMAPNMKAVERFAWLPFFFKNSHLGCPVLNDAYFIRFSSV